MVLTIRGGSLAGLGAEGAGEGALIVEAAFEGDGAGGVVGGDEVLAGGAHALAAVAGGLEAGRRGAVDRLVAEGIVTFEPKAIRTRSVA
mgnify:CR=1 FL=1